MCCCDSGATVSSTFYLDSAPRSVDDGAKTTKYSYDGAGARVARADTPDTAGTSYLTTYAYLDAGLVSSMSSSVVASGSTSWTYDAAGRPLQEVDPNGQKVTTTFTADNTLASRQLASSGGTTLASWSYLYNEDYQQTQQAFSGQGASGGTLYTATLCYHYDAASRLDTLSTAAATCPAPPAANISWDHDGNRLTSTDLTSAQTTTASYRADNSIATTTPSGGATQTYGYYPFGGLCEDGASVYGYDGFDRLSKLTKTSTSSCPASYPSTPVPAATYSYDGLDRQASHTEVTSPATTLHYDGLTANVAVETGPILGPVVVDVPYVLDPSGGKHALAPSGASSLAQFLTDDGHGNLSTATDGTQLVQCTVRYDPFGTPIRPQSATNPCNTGTTSSDHFYRGARRDATTADYQFGSRTYDPGKASFLTPDSYRTGGSGTNLGVGTDPLTENTYGYVNGDPVNLVDPNGHYACRTEGVGSGGCTPYENAYQAVQERGGDTIAAQAAGQRVQASADQLVPLRREMRQRFAPYQRLNQLNMSYVSDYLTLIDESQSEDCGFARLRCTVLAHAAGGLAGGIAGDLRSAGGTVVGGVSTGLSAAGSGLVWVGGQLVDTGQAVVAGGRRAAATVEGVVAAVPGVARGVAGAVLRPIGGALESVGTRVGTTLETIGEGAIKGGSALTGIGALVTGGYAAYEQWQQTGGMPLWERVTRSLFTGASVGGYSYFGSVVGAEAGTAIGGALCTPFGPEGTAACGVAGGVTGAWFGGVEGARFGWWVADSINDVYAPRPTSARSTALGPVAYCGAC
jgi:RHS repeat-associated protein